MSRTPQQLSLSPLLSLGVRQSASLAPATLSLAAARALSSSASLLISWSLLEAFLAGSVGVGLGIAGGLLVLWLTAVLAEGVVLAGALRQGRERMLGAEVPSLLQAILREAQRGLLFPLWLGALQLFRSLWSWGALLAGVTLYARAFEGRGSGLLASVALALALVVPLLLGLLLLVWSRVGLVQAVHEEQGISVGLFEALGLLRSGFGLPLMTLLLFGLFAFFGEGLVTSIVTPLSNLRDASPLTMLRMASLSSLMVVCVGAIPVMLFEHAGWQGLMAWRLGRSGLLPPEALPTGRPARIVQAAPVLAGAGAGMTGGVVFDAVPSESSSPMRSALPSAPAGSEPIVEAQPISSAGSEPIVEAQPISSAGSEPIVEAQPISSAGSEPIVEAQPISSAGSEPIVEAQALPATEPEPIPRAAPPQEERSTPDPTGAASSPATEGEGGGSAAGPTTGQDADTPEPPKNSGD